MTVSKTADQRANRWTGAKHTDVGAVSSIPAAPGIRRQD